MEAWLHHAGRVDYCGHVKRDCNPPEAGKPGHDEVACRRTPLSDGEPEDTPRRGLATPREPRGLLRSRET